MSPRVEFASVNILNGLLAGAIYFKPHLNIISGENGTLKTKLLQQIQQTQYVAHPPAPPNAHPRVQAISPKRNSERKTVATIVAQLRQNNRTREAAIAERLSTQMLDTQYQEYLSVGELYILEYQDRIRDGGVQVDHMRAVINDFNSVIRTVFPEYELRAEWDESTGIPNLTVLKGGKNELTLDALSLGEQEVLSLITNLYVTHESFDVCLIDEPEVHLNWHLEERLFNYFYEFCENFDKQMIVVTHSRVVFTDRFLPLTIFFHWGADGRVHWGDEITQEQRERIAGEAIEIIKLGDLGGGGTFWVEDKAQEVVIRAIAEQENVKIRVVVSGNAPNVRSLYKRSKGDGGWSGAYFLEDGDGQGSPFPGEPNFIHLDKYCIENYLLDLPTAAIVTGRTEEDLQEIIFNEIQARRNAVLGKNKFLDFLFDGMQADHLTPDRLGKLDASLIFDGYLVAVGVPRDDYIERYVSAASEAGTLEVVFPSAVVEAIRQSAPEDLQSGR